MYTGTLFEGCGDGPDPNLDSDGDGATNGEEAVAGTDPNDPNSVFQATETERTGDGVRVTWSSVEGKAYDIEYSSDLINWNKINDAAIPADAGGSTSFEDTDADRTSAPVGFYRTVIP